MNYGWLNIGSILFGLIAIAIPIINLMKKYNSNNESSSSREILSSVSISACAIALCMQILYVNHLVNIGDFVAMMDTFSIVVNASVVLLVATISLNIINYCKGKGIIH